MLRPSGCRESVPLEWGEARVGDGERQEYGDVGRHPRSAPRVALGCRPRRGYGLPPKMFLRQSSHHARQYRHGPRDHQPRRAVEGEEPLLQVDVIPLPSDYPVKTSRNNSNNNNNNDREYNSENDETKSREIPIFEFLFLFFVSSPSVTKHWEIRNIPPELQQPRPESTRPSPTRYGRPRTRQSSSAPRPRRPVSGRRSTSTRTIDRWSRGTPTSTRPTSRTRRTRIEDSSPTPRPRPA